MQWCGVLPEAKQMERSKETRRCGPIVPCRAVPIAAGKASSPAVSRRSQGRTRPVVMRPHPSVRAALSAQRNGIRRGALGLHASARQQTLPHSAARPEKKKGNGWKAK
ncbi:hypothetical protein MRX96_026893 [Rhipicephalus microplus]